MQSSMQKGTQQRKQQNKPTDPVKKHSTQMLKIICSYFNQTIKSNIQVRAPSLVVVLVKIRDSQFGLNL